MGRQIIIASHGNLAEGMYHALSIILGKSQLQNITYLNCYMQETQDVVKDIKDLLEQNDEELLVFTDLFGGSVNTTFYSFIDKKEFKLIAGMSLPLVIESILFQGNMKNLICHLKQISDQCIVFQDSACAKAQDEEF